MIKTFFYPVNLLAIAAIKSYQKAKRRKNGKCLHFPSCSAYGILAFRKYHCFKALRVTLYRIRDCNPLSNRPYIDYP